MFVFFVLLNLIGSQIVVGVIATDDDYGTTYAITYYQLPYGNGIDDNGDGVVDDINETDVVYGERNVTQSDRVINTWSENFSFPSPREYGIEIGGSFERLYEVSVNAKDPASSISPIYDCYYVDENDSSFNYSIKDNVINMVSFYMQLSSEGLMNGASEIWYRSSIVWNEQIFKEYYLNIYETNYSGPDKLIYATTDSTIDTPPHPYVIHDGSGYDRIYQKLNINFKTNTQYIFMEYIKTIDDVPLNNFQMFFLDFQDLGKDNETATYVFWDSSHSNKILRECSWSMVPVIGIGMGGIEIPIWSNTSFNTTYYPEILSSKLIGGNSELNVGSANFTIPLRCTQLTNFTIFVKTWSGNDVSNWTSGVNGSTTGTIIIQLPVDDPNATEPNIYQLCIRFTNLNTSDNAVLFKVYPSAGSISAINYNSSYVDVYHFASHIELIAEHAASTTVDDSSTDLHLIIGIGLIIAGVVILILTWWTGVGFGVGVSSIATGSTTITLTGIGFAAGVLMITAGSYTIIQTLINAGLAEGILRGMLSFIEGVAALLNSIWDLILQVIEAIQWFIEAMLTWGGDILWAIAEVIYFVAFLLVMIMWNIFLSTMRYIATGDIEGAWASLKKPFLKSYRWVRKRPVYKIARTAATTAITKGAVKTRTAIKYRRGVH